MADWIAMKFMDLATLGLCGIALWTIWKGHHRD